MSKSRIPVRKKVILCLVIKDLVFVRTFCSKNWRIGGFLKCLLIVKRRVDQAKATSLPQTSKMEHVNSQWLSVFYYYCKTLHFRYLRGSRLSQLVAEVT